MERGSAQATIKPDLWTTPSEFEATWDQPCSARFPACDPKSTVRTRFSAAPFQTRLPSTGSCRRSSRWDSSWSSCGASQPTRTAEANHPNCGCRVTPPASTLVRDTTLRRYSMIRTSAGDAPSDIQLGPRLLPFVDRLPVPRRLVAAENEGRLVVRLWAA